jgi:uncharacterized protein (TIGR00725 family)
MKRIAVFGAASPRPGQPAYKQAQRLGDLLGKAGYIVMTGGYVGTMEAVSRGAAEAGAHVIGVTCDEIENFRFGSANPWVKEEIRTQALRERIHVMISTCDAALALPGGIGTLTEVSLMWNVLLIGAIAPRPLLLIGEGWQSTIDAFYQGLGDFIPQREHSWLSFAPDVEAAVSHLNLLLPPA